jgi:hypothetical protein
MKIAPACAFTATLPKQSRNGTCLASNHYLTRLNAKKTFDQ